MQSRWRGISRDALAAWLVVVRVPFSKSGVGIGVLSPGNFLKDQLDAPRRMHRSPYSPKLFVLPGRLAFARLG